MPIRPCPSCGNMTPRELSDQSPDNIVWYYRCDRCGQAWSIQKHDPGARQETIFPRDRPPISPRFRAG